MVLVSCCCTHPYWTWDSNGEGMRNKTQSDWSRSKNSHLYSYCQCCLHLWDLVTVHHHRASNESGVLFFSDVPEGCYIKQFFHVTGFVPCYLNSLTLDYVLFILNIELELLSQPLSLPHWQILKWISIGQCATYPGLNLHWLKSTWHAVVQLKLFPLLGNWVHTVEKEDRYNVVPRPFWPYL